VTSRDAWIAAGVAVARGERSGLRCPENDDDVLDVRWLPGPAAGGAGEWRLRCPTCGAQNFVRKGAGG